MNSSNLSINFKPAKHQRAVLNGLAAAATSAIMIAGSFFTKLLIRASPELSYGPSANLAEAQFGQPGPDQVSKPINQRPLSTS